MVLIGSEQLVGGDSLIREILRKWCPAAIALALAAGAAAADEYASVRETLQQCFTCHGPNGASTDPAFPILAGQHLHYLYVQLKDFKSQYRKSEIMSPVAANLEKSDMLTIAKFFSEQKWPNIGYRATPESRAGGETATAAGQCVQCHRGGYEGDSRVPRLAGQYPEYLRQTMLDFKNKKRTNSPAKSSLMVSYGDNDITAIAEFLADL
jgi:cytochrome c553